MRGGESEESEGGRESEGREERVREGGESEGREESEGGRRE